MTMSQPFSRRPGAQVWRILWSVPWRECGSRAALPLLHVPLLVPVSDLVPHNVYQGRKLSAIRCQRSGGKRKARERQGEREILRLRGPTRHSSARKRKSGRSAPFDSAQGRQDDNKEERRGRKKKIGEFLFWGGFMSELKLRPPKEEERAVSCRSSRPGWAGAAPTPFNGQGGGAVVFLVAR